MRICEVVDKLTKNLDKYKGFYKNCSSWNGGYFKINQLNKIIYEYNKFDTLIGNCVMIHNVDWFLDDDFELIVEVPEGYKKDAFGEYRKHSDYSARVNIFEIKYKDGKREFVSGHLDLPSSHVAHTINNPNFQDFTGYINGWTYYVNVQVRFIKTLNIVQQFSAKLEEEDG